MAGLRLVCMGVFMRARCIYDVHGGMNSLASEHVPDQRSHTYTNSNTMEENPRQKQKKQKNKKRLGKNK